MITIVDGVEGKVCDTCSVWLNLTGFYKDKYSKDGYDHWCKFCKTAFYQRSDKSCTSCKRNRRDFKDYGGYLDEVFGKHKSYCKACERENFKQRTASNGVTYPALIKAQEKRRKSESEAGFIDYYESKLLKMIYGDFCLYSDNENGSICGISCKSHSDHVIPLSKNGMHYAYNRQPLCRSHNSSKSNHNNIDYRPDQGILAMAIHNLRIGQCNDRKQKQHYYDWVVQQIQEKSPQVLLTLPDIFQWLELQETTLELAIAA